MNKINVYRPKFLLAILVLLLITPIQAQITTRFPAGSKSTYAVGDTFTIILTLKSRPETCMDGMKKTKTYLSGLAPVRQTDWVKTGTAVFRKVLLLEVLSGKREKATLTVLRKVDKENLFHQEVFVVKH